MRDSISLRVSQSVGLTVFCWSVGGPHPSVGQSRCKIFEIYPHESFIQLFRNVNNYFEVYRHGYVFICACNYVYRNTQRLSVALLGSGFFFRRVFQMPLKAFNRRHRLCIRVSVQSFICLSVYSCIHVSV